MKWRKQCNRRRRGVNSSDPGSVSNGPASAHGDNFGDLWEVRPEGWGPGSGVEGSEY